MKSKITPLAIAATMFMGCMATEPTVQGGDDFGMVKIEVPIEERIATYTNDQGDSVGLYVPTSPSALIRLEDMVQDDPSGGVAKYSFNGDSVLVSYTRPGYFLRLNAAYDSTEGMDSIPRQRILDSITAANHMDRRAIDASMCDYRLSGSAKINIGDAVLDVPIVFQEPFSRLFTFINLLDYSTSLPSGVSSVDFKGKSFVGVATYSCPDPRDLF